MNSASPPTLALGADEHVPGRGFCDPAHTAGDVGTLTALRDAVRRQAVDRRTTVSAASRDEHRRALRRRARLGCARATTSRLPWSASSDNRASRSTTRRSLPLEHQIVARAGAFPGLLSYHNAQLDDNRWGNMVVFSSRAASRRPGARPRARPRSGERADATTSRSDSIAARSPTVCSERPTSSSTRRSTSTSPGTRHGAGSGCTLARPGR